VGIVGPRLQHEDVTFQASARKFPNLLHLIANRFPLFPSTLSEYLMSSTDFQKPQSVDWLVGAVLLMKRDLFLSFQGFDERFFLFFEDTDLCRRVRGMGLSVYLCPDAVFTHPRQRLSESDFPGMWLFKPAFWIHVVSAVKYFLKWRFSRRGTSPSRATP
jgi:GT2 family glycosyltransferase